MALVVEDGSGLSNADSYLSVADADTYLANYGDPAAWSAASDAAKETALREATRYLDAKYLSRWSGIRASDDQALAWPRIDVEDSDDFILSSTALPQRLKDATAVMASAAISADIYPDVSGGEGSMTAKSVTVGPITTSRKFSGSGEPYKTYRLAHDMIRDYLTSSNRIYRA